MRKVLFILGQLTDEDVAWISRTGRRAEVSAGEKLITMGRRIEDVIIVLEGTVTVSVGPKVLAQLGRGEMLGEMSLIENVLPSAGATAAGPATLLLVPLQALRAKLDTETAFAARFYKAIALLLADRMRGTISTFGYGGPRTLDELDELDDQVMDTLTLAGLRFLSVLDSVIAEPKSR